MRSMLALTLIAALAIPVAAEPAPTSTSPTQRDIDDAAQAARTRRIVGGALMSALGAGSIAIGVYAMVNSRGHDFLELNPFFYRVGVVCVVGGVGELAIGTYLLARPSKEERRTVITPVAGGGAAVSYIGTF
jgi:hypothetical protein